MLQKFPAVGHESSRCRVGGHPDLRRYKAGGFIIWFRCILFSALPEVTGPAGIVGACLGPETLRYEFPDMSKEKQLPGDAIRGIIDVGQGADSTFTPNVYSEFITPAGVKAKGFKRSVEPASYTTDRSQTAGGGSMSETPRERNWHDWRLSKQEAVRQIIE
jgi:hypothetical protein